MIAYLDALPRADATEHPILIVGRLGKAHGIRGWQYLQSFTSPPENLFDYRPWHLQHKTQPHWFLLETVEWREYRGGFLVRLPKISAPESARDMIGTHIGVSKAALGEAQEDEYFWHELIGCTVVNQQGIQLGRIEQLFETGAHPVMVVEGGEKSHLIPFTRAFALTVDLPKKEVQVNWMEEWT